MKKKDLNGNDIAKAALRRIEEGGTLATMDKKKIQAIEKAVQDGVELLLSLAFSSKKPLTPTKKPPHQTAKQAAHHHSNLNSTKIDMKKRYSAALKEATKLCVSGGVSLCKIACGMKNTSLRGSGD